MLAPSSITGFLSLILLLHLNIRAQEKPNNCFVELNASIIHYNSEWNRQTVNPGSGIALGLGFGSRVSGELFYGNNHIIEDITGSNHNSTEYITIHHNYFAHQAGFRLCLGREQTNHSLKGLFGVSFGYASGFGIDTGLRFTKNIGRSFGIHAAFIESFYPFVSINDTPYGWDDPMETYWVTGFRLGIAYHFYVEPKPITP